ncbi:nucleoside/nucleotide kinase family protein [Flavisphingomonas formosensis]|uniref:nucleoside triphosphate hydrolase n=1 Tax=Flavisphingomonas formosensis TaxID=861534 RepID=UPI0012F79C3E|nr:nucleoside triphosphate hydrolase [Sphingomonas formosensis]
MTSGQPPLIAVVGCDGSGKSTVTTILRDWMAQERRTALCHLGKQTGNIGRRIARLPFMGKRLDKTIHEKAQVAKTKGGPGILTALVIYAFSMRRVRRFRRMLALRRQGYAIVADRFPQMAVPGPMDGMALADVELRNAVVRFLSRREQAQYRWMTAHRPDLVIRLNVSLETALARKPDHRPSSLARKVADVPRLSFQGAPIVDIDAQRPLPEVLEEAKRAVRAVLDARDGAPQPR